MPPRKPTKSTVAKLATTIQDLSAGLNLLILRPLKDVKQIGNYGRRFSSPRSRKSSSHWKLPLTVIVGLLSLLVKILLAPLELWSACFRQKSLGRMGWLAIAGFGLLVLGLSGYGGYCVVQNQQLAALRIQASDAFDKKQHYEAAQLFADLQRSQVTLTPAEQFQYWQSLARSDQTDQAAELLACLAPGPGLIMGYPPAHRFSAMTLVRTASVPYSPATQQLLKWHLESGRRGTDDESVLRQILEADDFSPRNMEALERHSGDPTLTSANGTTYSAEFEYAQARYFESTNQHALALAPMQQAAKKWPRLHLAVVTLCERIGNQKLRQTSLSKAQRFLTKRVNNFPQEHRSRVQLAQVYLKLAEPDQAQKQLELGAQLAPNVFRPQLSNFYLDYWRQLPAAATSEQRFAALDEALRQDIDNVAVYDAIIQTFRSATSDQRSLIWRQLQKSAGVFPEAPLPRFAMGILHRLEQRPIESLSEIEAAYERLDPAKPGFAAVANNLAWLLAHDQQPDLQQAYRLAHMAVQQHPGVGSLRDTLATILMKQGNLDDALIEFQKSLPTVRDKSAVHQKMAEIYDQLQQPQLATLHRHRANSQ